MKTNNKSTHKMNRFKKRAISMSTAIAILMGSIPMSDLSDTIRKLSDKIFQPLSASAYEKYSVYDYTTKEDGTNHIKIATWENLVDYSKAYYEASYGTYGDDVTHQNDTILIAIASDASSDVDLASLGYEPIGNSEKPFAGKIIFETGSPETFNLDCPIFGEVYDNVQIVQRVHNPDESIDETQTKQINITRTIDKPGVPLIANKVLSDDDPDTTATWSAQFAIYTPYADRVVQYGGAIGEIQSGASVNLTFVNNAVSGTNITNVKTNASANDGSDHPVDAGVLCGHLNGSLTATYSGTNEDYTITSENGNAGGFVGSMGPGSELSVTTGANLQTSSETLIKATNGCAGGLVGSNNGGKVTHTLSGVSTYDIAQTILGQNGAGGLYGYYNAPADSSSNPANTTTIDVSKYNINCNVGTLSAGVGASGGLIGVSGNNYTLNISGGNSGTTVESNHNGDDAADSAYYGGLIGQYTAGSTSATLNIENLTAVPTNTKNAGVFGGAISKLDSGSYVRLDSFTLSSAAGKIDGTFGGVVADADGAYVYAKDITIGSSSSIIDGFTGGGLVGKLGNGILGMEGTIDVSNGKPTVAPGNGHLVGSRGNALIYAESGWTYSSSSVKVDNVGSWGDVMVFGSNLAKTDVFNNETGHVITLKSVDTSDIDSVGDYAVTSILFQIDPSENPFLNGTRLADNTALTFTNDINLSGTGLRGITRDDGDDTKVVGTTYKGTATGTSGKTITLDIKNVGGKPVYYHTYLGLFGRTNNAVLNTLTLSGTINVENNKASSGEIFVGAAAAQASGTFTASNCSTAAYTESNGTETGLKLNISGASPVQCGRLLGYAPDKIGNITVSNSTFDGKITGTASADNTRFGGVIGQIGKPEASVTWSFSGLTIKGTVESTISTKKNQKLAGLVASLNGDNKATVNLNNIYYDGLTISGTASETQGGLLGYSWGNADVNVNNVSLFKDTDNDGVNTLTASTVEAKGAGGTAGLIYQATGHWTVNTIDLTGIIMKAGSAGSVGMIVNKGVSDSNGIYLELPPNYNYSLSFDANSNVTASVNGNKFDEICAYSSSGVDKIMNNGQGIVSISSSTGLKMETTAEDSLTYKPRTTQGKTPNPNTRYYYNLDTIDRDNTITSSDPQKQLMRWGLNQYAASNIKKYFPDPFSSGTITSADYDMKGYSWYPVTPNSAITVNGTFTFYNKEYESCEKESGKETNGGVEWSSLAGTQHNMMQNGLFYNINNNLTIETVNLKGTVGAKDTSGTGALVYGTVSGSSSATEDITVVDSTSGTINLDGVTIWNYQTKSANYAPLLINKTGSFVNLKISNVFTTSTYAAGAEAATSLIGRAGGDDDTYVSVNFSNIKLDARTTANSPNLSTYVYNTTKSIFTRATLLERLVGESGIYNYTYDDDWGSGSHKVTYGEEVGYTTTNKPNSQYPEQEQWYARSSTSDAQKATQYSSNPTTATPSDSFSGFLPYVKTVSTAAQITAGTGKYYQLKVNHQPTDVIEGCGTYNDPYIIKTEDELVKISKWISGTDLNSATINAEFTDTWCTGKTEHKTYSGSNGSSFVSQDSSSDTKDYTEMRKYLCEAYYSIEPISGTEITINMKTNVTSDFIGLGTKDNGFRFRGVIVGNNNTIINKTPYPFIAYSDGSVVKDLTIKVDTSSIKDNRITCRGDSKKYVEPTQPYNQIRAYGAVFGQIVGGDNVIDNVQLDLSKINIYMNGDKGQYVPVGGYVGVIIDGGLVFRRMPSSGISGLTDNTKITNDQNKTTTTMINSDNNMWMFVNPIIGRVINGYAVTESSTGYKPREANVTMKNSTGDHTVVKHYSIADIATSGSALTVNSSSKTIAVPDSQAFYVMSLIVNSGMGANLLGYQATSGTNYFMRRHAAYSAVGSTASSSDACEDYNLYASLDSLSSTAYLIYKYAGGSAPIGSNNWTVNLETNGSYDLPDGFRGIGNLFNDNDNLRLNISTFNGNGATINQNTKYYYYSTDCVDAYKPPADASNNQNAGLGLINCQVINGSFSNLILTGSVKCDAIAISNGEHMTYTALASSGPNATNSTNSSRNLSAAMLLATVKYGNYPTIDSVALQNVNVNGVRHTGGLIGNVPHTGTHKENNKDVPNVLVITNTLSLPSYGITVHGAGITGGMIGRSNQGSIDINNNDATYSIVEVVSYCTSRGAGKDYDYGVGGFIGVARSGGTGFITIQNVIVGTAKQNKTSVKCEGAELNTGGMVGIMNKCYFTVSNCKVYNQSIISQYTAAGLIGYNATPSGNSTISNVLISCRDELNGEITSSNNFAGGFIGAAKRDVNYVTIENSSISGYTITGKDYAGGVSGLWGHYAGDVQNKNSRLIMNNFKISNCTISSDTYSGGIVGYLNRNEENIKDTAESVRNTKKECYGYNILEENVKVRGANKGCVCGGTLNTDYNIIKIVGFSRQESLGEGETSEMAQDLVGSGDCGTGGYVIFADYKGAVSNETWTPDSVVAITNSLTRVTEASPFVTVNPKTEIDAASTPKYLTSDGANLLAVTQIMNDIERTTPPAGYYDIASSGESALTNKVASFVDEMGTKTISIGGRDFPVLIVDDISATNTTTRINDYIALLTNTTPYSSSGFNYASTDDSTVFKTVIHRCTYDSNGEILTIGAGQTTAYSDASAPNNSYPTLKRGSTQFYMNANDTDSKEENAQFTLIDIQYLDPSAPGNIAYHLYVPVYVRKVLQYDFNIHVESGTTYKVNAPSNIIKNTLLENVGTPITIEFAFTYDRDASDWITAVNGGDSLLTNYPKKLKFDNSTTRVEGVRPNFPAGTKMVLIDSQDYSKAYYLDDIYAYTSGENPEIDNEHSAFRGTDSEKYLYLDMFTNGSDSFSPIRFNDLMIVTIVQDNNGTLVNSSHVNALYPDIVTDNSGGSNNGQSFRYSPAGETGINPEDRYTVSSISFKNGGSYLTEHYFLSIYTPYADSDTVYHYAISAGKDLGSDPYPSRISKASENNAVNLFMGNIYNQEIHINSLSVGGDEENYIISASGNDNQLTADLEAIITLTNSAKQNGMKTYIGDPQTAPNIYESLLIQFNKHTLTDSDIGIKGVEDVDVSTYTINGTNVTSLNTSWNKNENIVTNSSFIELQNVVPLARTLYTNDSVNVRAVATVTFDKENGGISQQFYPLSPDTNRTNVIALSKISSNSSTVAYSKVSEQTNKLWDPINKQEGDTNEYYTEDTEEATITHEALEMPVDGQLPQLGINPNDPNDLKKLPSPIHTIGTYDVEKCPTSWQNAQYIVFEIELKSIDSNYVTKLPIFNYIEADSFKILEGIYPAETAYLDSNGSELTPTITEGKTILPAETHTIRVTYTKESLSSKLDDDIYQIPIEFKVYSDSDFEGKGLKYANYGVYLKAFMLDSSENIISVTTSPAGGDFVKYTNARIYIEKVDPSKAS